MEQERSTWQGAGTRLAAPALRARQRASGTQATLDFNEPAWDGPVPEIAPDDRGGYWPSSAAGWAGLPWADSLAVLRRVAVIGAMGAAGFALVLYGARPHPAARHAAAPVEAVANAAPPADTGTAPPQPTPGFDRGPATALAPASIPADGQMAAAKPAPWGVDPLAPAAASTVVPSTSLAPASLAPASLAPASLAQVTPREMPQAPASPTAAPPRMAVARHHAVAAARARVHPPMAQLAARPASHVLAMAHARPHAAHHAVQVADALPGWLTQPNRAKSAPLVMSDPPHTLSPPPGMAPAPARAAMWRLPALREPARSAPTSGIYYGAGAMPPASPAADP